ncbi:glycosyltransferase family 2 protein [Thalassobellus citreus]|uniref:glycosyltransferase family 2 protein n=1 Tax=Thalassobellus citreus TaxID=3367752 RepID=UPI00378EABA4
MTLPLVSIIIPIYNRNKLIKETLNSILKQTYTNWECIIVDDGSTDSTPEVLKVYCKKDQRFKSYARPSNRLKGGNASRNFGFEKSNGAFVIWFDSDDLMVANHIELKLENIIISNVDFVIAKTANFKGSKLHKPYNYVIPEYGIRAEDFILRKIHWYTYDVMLSKTLAEKVIYNERLKSWQDYNYFCKMLLISTNGKYIDTVLTHRRLHSNSIQMSMNKTKVAFNLELLENKVYTYLDIVDKISENVRKDYLNGLMNISFYLAKEKRISSHTFFIGKEVKKVMAFKNVFWFLVSLLSAFFMKKGEFFLNKSKGKK